MYIKPQQIRSIFSYAQKFKDNIFVIHMNSLLLQNPYLERLVRDIEYLLKIGVKIIIVLSTKQAIDELFRKYQRNIVVEKNIRVFNYEDMELVQMASYDCVARCIHSFSRVNKTAVMGNWILARGLGVKDGVDFQNTGRMIKLQQEVVLQLLEEGIVPIIPPIGWSNSGKQYSIESIELASSISAQLHADKLFYLVSQPIEQLLEPIVTPMDINKELIETDNDGNILRITKENVETLLNMSTTLHQTQAYHLLSKTNQALTQGLKRVHLLNGTIDGVLLEELFSHGGMGVMINMDEYRTIYPAKKDDINTIYSLMQPLMEQKILVSRTLQQIKDTLENYIVYTIDGDICGFAALYTLDDTSGEIASLVVDEDFNREGIGKYLIQYLLLESKKRQYTQVFVFTQMAGDWFESLNFEQVTLDSVPAQRRQLYQEQNRNSRIYRIFL